MSARSKKSRDTSNSQLNDNNLSGDYEPVIIEWGKKFAAYDKNGKLIILGYNRRIVERYANSLNNS